MDRPVWRTALTGVLVFIVVVLLVVGVTMKIRTNRSVQAGTDLLAIGRSVELPPGSKPYVQAGTSCWPTSYVRCAFIDTDADTAARQMQALVSIAADQEARLICGPGASKQVGSRICEIRIDRDQHVLFVSVVSNLKLVDGRILIDGSEIRIARP